jgi:hypothetical protein
MDDLTATAIADVFAALDSVRAAEAPGIVFGEPVGHGKIRLHGRDEPAAPAAPPAPAPAVLATPVETAGHGKIRLHGRER